MVFIRLGKMLSIKDEIIQKLDSFSELQLSQLLEFADQIQQQTLEDQTWGLKAQQAEQEGFIGTAESELLLEEILNAEV
jgi:hypothetical protein